LFLNFEFSLPHHSDSEAKEGEQHREQDKRRDCVGVMWFIHTNRILKASLLSPL